MPSHAGPARLFADDYSTTGQIQWRASASDPGPTLWERDFLGQLRFDTLVSATLVVPDTHIFDGPYFLSTDPSKLTKLLARDADGAVTSICRLRSVGTQRRSPAPWPSSYAATTGPRSTPSRLDRSTSRL